MSKIAILSPFSEFTKMLRNICLDNDQDIIEVVEAYGSEALHTAQKLENAGFEAIIARRFTAAHLKENKLPIPIIDLRINELDLLQKMHQIVSMGFKKIGCLFYSEELMDYDFEAFEEILGIKILPLPYHLPGDDIEDQVQRAIKNEVDFVLTTGICIARKCVSNGLRVEVVYPRKSSVITGIQRARETIAANKQYLDYSRQLQTIINSTRDGMLVVDSNLVITMINPVAEKIFNVVAGEIVGKSVNSIHPQLDLSSLVHQHRQEEDKIVRFDNRQLVIKWAPLNMDNNLVWGTLFIVQDVSEVQRLDQQIRAENIARGLKARFELSHIWGVSQKIQKVKNQARRYAESDSTILITGESGTGKELIAQAIHNSSSRKNGPFVAVNCASLPETLLESELFGYEKGAFTGADKNGKAGLFELAHKGTIFLDEIGDCPVSLQAKLLRVLQEKEVRRIGSEKIIPVDVRVLAATNKDLLTEIKKRNFREDLYYRLNVLSIKVPPLRERKDDIGELSNLFIERCRAGTVKKVPPFSPVQIRKLSLYHWPGNIRELENFVERYVLLYRAGDNVDSLIDQFLIESVSQENFRSEDPDVLEIRIGTLKEMELQIFIKMVEGLKLDKNKVASLLNISRTTLWKKLRDVGYTVVEK
ncbi:MAG: sigma 54-interacting transcriptional regulator [Bacillota bacterium]